MPPGGRRPLGQRLQQFLPFVQPLHAHLFRHQMLTYLTSKGLTDAQIQLISGHESKKSLEVYQHLSLESVDKAYQDALQSVGI
jgi:site-specific recombinase XerD